MNTLIINLADTPNDAAALYDYVLSPDGNTVGEQSRAPLALLPLIDKAGGEVVAMVDARHLSWHQVQLPPGTLGRRVFQEGGATRLRAVLEGLLEERLLDDTEQLHFAIEPQPDANAPVWVAVCERAWLRSALQALERSGRRVSRIVPEFTPESLTSTLYVVGEPEAAQLICASAGSIAVWPAASTSVALLNWSEDQPIIAEPAVAALAEQLFKRSVSLQHSAQRHLLAAQSAWDLAQFDFANSNSARNWKRGQAALAAFLKAPRWQPARLALLALLAINLVGLNAWAWKEKSVLGAQRQAINNVLTSTFPTVMVVNAPLQMAKEVAALEHASGLPSNRDLDRMGSAFVLAAHGNVTPTAIEFIPGELRMKGLTLSEEEVSNLSFKLKPQGYSASVEADSLLIKPEPGS